MKRDEEEENDAGYSLNQIKPIARVRVVQIVWPRLHRYHEAVDGVIDERYKDSANFDEQNIGNRLQVFYGIVEICRPTECFGVCVEMLEQEDPERHDAGQLMKFAQDKSPAQTNRQERTPPPSSFGTKSVGPSSGRL